MSTYQEKTENDIFQKSHGKFLSSIGIRSPADCYDHELLDVMPWDKMSGYRRPRHDARSFSYRHGPSCPSTTSYLSTYLGPPVKRRSGENSCFRVLEKWSPKTMSQLLVDFNSERNLTMHHKITKSQFALLRMRSV